MNKSAMLVKRLDKYRILWHINLKITADEGDDFSYIITTISFNGAHAYLATEDGSIADARIITGSEAPKESHIEVLKALGYEVL